MLVWKSAPITCSELPRNGDFCFAELGQKQSSLFLPA